MYVCICQGITDRQIRETLERGAESLCEVQLQVPVGACCGRCLPTAQEVVDEHREQIKARSFGRAA